MLLGCTTQCRLQTQHDILNPDPESWATNRINQSTHPKQDVEINISGAEGQKPWNNRNNQLKTKKVSCCDHSSLTQSTVMTKSAFIGGSLSFKGDKKKSKKKRSKHKLEGESRKQKKQKKDDSTAAAQLSDNDDEDLTEAERRALKFKRERQRRESEKIAAKSHRERVEELNEKLGSLTEHNDIPRVSAAGNG